MILCAIKVRTKRLIGLSQRLVCLNLSVLQSTKAALCRRAAAPSHIRSATPMCAKGTANLGFLEQIIPFHQLFIVTLNGICNGSFNQHSRSGLHFVGQAVFASSPPVKLFARTGALGGKIYFGAAVVLVAFFGRVDFQEF